MSDDKFQDSSSSTVLIVTELEEYKVKFKVLKDKVNGNINTQLLLVEVYKKKFFNCIYICIYIQYIIHYIIDLMYIIFYNN